MPTFRKAEIQANDHNRPGKPKGSPTTGAEYWQGKQAKRLNITISEADYAYLIEHVSPFISDAIRQIIQSHKEQHTNG